MGSQYHNILHSWRLKSVSINIIQHSPVYFWCSLIAIQSCWRFPLNLWAQFCCISYVHHTVPVWPSYLGLCTEIIGWNLKKSNCNSWNVLDIKLKIGCLQTGICLLYYYRKLFSNNWIKKKRVVNFPCLSEKSPSQVLFLTIRLI